jgi:NAD(P)H dehydrogenase (quinone)
MYGHVRKLADAVTEGARQVAGAEVSRFLAPELVPDEARERTGAEATRAQPAPLTWRPAWRRWW